MIQRKIYTLETMGMRLEPGRIILVHYPFTDGTSAKVRPALVVSRLDLNQGADVVVMPISSRVREDDQFGYVLRDTEDYFPGTKLKFSSTVKWSKPMTIGRSVIRSKLGIVPAEVLEDILQRIRSSF